MGDDERLSAVADELGLLLDELRSLAANRSAGVHRKGVTNLYYASFHAVRALLAAHGIESRTHEGTQRLFAAHFVKPDLFDHAHLRTLGRLEADRLRADYQGYYRFGPEDIDQSLGEVGALSDAVLDYLSTLEPGTLAEPIAAVRGALAVVIPTRHRGQGSA
jgi:uncharacterized protein (UPF0332 family)